MHIKGWEGRRLSDLAISVNGMCVREVDMEEGKGRGNRSERKEGRGKGKGGVGRGREKKGEKEEEGRRERKNTENNTDGIKAYRAGEKRIHSI